MNPAELALQLEAFVNEIATLKGDVLLDRWIAFKGSEESRVPDLGLKKSSALEARLGEVFGLLDWYKKVEARKETQKNAEQ